MAKKTETVNILPVEMHVAQIHITGETPLIIHAWTEKAKKEILDKQMKTKEAKKAQREAKNPIADFATALYWIDNQKEINKIPYEDWNEELFEEQAKGARFGFPVTAIKQCGITAAYRADMVPNMTGLKASFFIDGIGENQLAEIETDAIPTMREDMVKVGMGTADIRHRPQFENWGMTLNVRYNANGKYSLEQIVNVINMGGQLNGLGEWRMEKDGVYGRFHVDDVKEIVF